MKLVLSLFLLFVLVPSIASVAIAEDEYEKIDAAQNLDNLRLKLIDIQAREAELQNRARQLEEDIKPENIERSLAGVGSTKPEELREYRRRQLSIQLESVRGEQKILATSRERLEAAIRTAEANAYHQSAQGPGNPVTQMLRAQYVARPRALIAFAGLLGLAGVAIALVMKRRFLPR